MNNFVVKEALKAALLELESSGDIVMATTTPGDIVNKLNSSVQVVSPNLLSTDEFSAVKNAVNVTLSGFYLDDNDFQTHIGLTREQLKEALDKLGNIE